MKTGSTAGLGRLNALQIAGLSIVTSTVFALGTLVALRRWVFKPTPAGNGAPPGLGAAEPFAGMPLPPDGIPSPFEETGR